MSLRLKLLSCAAVAGAVLASWGATSLTAHAQTARLEWSVENRHAADGTVDLNLIERRLTGQSSYGHNVPLADLRGLSAAELGGAKAHQVRFRLDRDAGSFACEGSAARDGAAGICDFEPGGRSPRS
jgi:hypothetical protein